MQEILGIIQRLSGQRGTLLVALQEIQARVGCVPEDAIALTAQAYGISQAEVRGVLGFYSELRTTPPGRHRVCVCRGDSCAATGAHAVAAAVEAHLNIPPGATTPDGGTTYESAYCLGICALSPSVMIDGEVHARISPGSVARLLEEVERA